MHVADPKLPPLFTGHGVKAPTEPRDYAVAGARHGELGAGDVVWARTIKAVRLAFVLEPDVPVRRIAEIRVLLQTAIIDSLGVLMPEQTAIQFGWPNAIHCNGAKVGETVFVCADVSSDDVHPTWAVASVSIDLSRDLDGLEPGLVKAETSLEEEDGGHLNRTEVIEALSAHFMSAIYRWEHDGVRSLVEHWKGYLFGISEPAEIEVPEPVREGLTKVTGQIIGVGDDLELFINTNDHGVVVLSDPLLRAALTSEPNA
ncbi:MAG: biotin/lipoate--protein ligase family protein [Pseudomonadota bacterium]